MAKLFLIEDDPTTVSLLSTLLDLEGYQVITPRDHQLNILINNVILEQPQVALIDVNLLQGNGLDLVRAIRNEPDVKGMRIIMYSGLNMQEECMQAGADDFIQKPFIPDELIKRISVNVQT